ncbi:hypothetical protein B0H34DRAFT_783698 [Crassisporium funariophilum]|nr:hypothetical protein B0H34DRAFT_783698 [Crassisporium funariophilum]
MSPGFLAVLSEPGSLVTLDEFQDWYNNEHVPLRLDHLSSFLSGARYQAIDGTTPSWIALYEIDDTKTFQHESYTRLRENRSPREKDLIGRLEVLDRRTCGVLNVEEEERARTTGLRLGNPTGWLVTHGVEGDIGKWMESAFGELRKEGLVQGWVRTRVLEVLENGKTGVVPPYFVIHGMLWFDLCAGVVFVSHDAVKSEAFFDIIDTKEGAQISEVRKWGLYKSYPCIAQGNLVFEG